MIFFYFFEAHGSTLISTIECESETKIYTICQYKNSKKRSKGYELGLAWHVWVREQNLTLKAPITTAADDKFFDIFPNFQKKYHAVFEIFEKAAKFEIVVCCKL